MLNTFKRGGVHPDDGKIYAKDKAIETPAVPAQVVIPMSQHFGAPCTPTVKARAGKRIEMSYIGG